MLARSLLPDRLAALAGVIFVTLAGAGAALGDPYAPATDPNPTQPADALAAALVRNRDQARLGAYLVLIGVFFLFWFIAYLHGRLREAEGEHGWFASVALGGGLVAAAVFLLGASMGFASSELPSYGADTQVAKTFFVWGWNLANIAAPPMIALVAATTVLALRLGLFPRWFRGFGVVWTVLLAVALLANMAGLGTMLSLVWVLAASLVLLIRPQALAVRAQ